MKSASEIYSPNAGQQFASRALSVIANVGADDELERLAHPRAVGDRMNRISVFDDHRAKAFWMVSEDFVGNHVGGDQTADDAMFADGGGIFRNPAAGESDKTRARVHPAALADVSGQREEQFFKVRVERAVERLLDTDTAWVRRNDDRRYWLDGRVVTTPTGMN